MNAEHPTEPATATATATSDPTPSTHPSEPTPTSLGRGATGPLTSKPLAADTTASASELDGEQMAAPGEGEIAQAQDTKHGFGEQADLASNLDEKKEEQRSKKEEAGDDEEGGGVAGETRPRQVGGEKGVGQEVEAGREEGNLREEAATAGLGDGDQDWGSRADVDVEGAVGGRGVPVVVAVEE